MSQDNKPPVPLMTSLLAQDDVSRWLIETFGAEYTLDRQEQNNSFFEEAAEVVQANGMSREQAHALVDFVFDRPAGEIGQEIGGLMVSLCSLANERDINIGAVFMFELQRCWDNSAAIKAKHDAKERPKDGVPVDKPMPEWNATNAQQATIMLLYGTTVQKVEALRFFNYWAARNVQPID